MTEEPDPKDHHKAWDFGIMIIGALALIGLLVAYGCTSKEDAYWGRVSEQVGRLGK